jgi:hypothetical protein
MQEQRDYIVKLLDIRWVRHLLFWIIYILTMSYIHGTGYNRGEFLPWILNYLIELPVLAGLSYSVTYGLIPGLLYQKKYILFFMGTSGLILFFSFINVLLENNIIIPMVFPAKGGILNLSLQNILVNAFSLLYPLGIFLTLSFVRLSFKKQEKIRLEQHERVMSELQMIRNQIHPVFLQDAMNELYRVANSNKGLLPALVLKLSEILNYLLFDCNSQEVSISGELNAIERYLEFQKSAHADNFDYSFHVNGNINGGMISPYILFPILRSACLFVESDDDYRGRVSVLTEKESDVLKLEINAERGGGLLQTVDFSWQDELSRAKRRINTVYSWNHKLNVLETDNRLSIHFLINFKS